jgi:hypothetical protein
VHINFLKSDSFYRLSYESCYRCVFSPLHLFWRIFMWSWNAQIYFYLMLLRELCDAVELHVYHVTLIREIRCHLLNIGRGHLPNQGMWASAVILSVTAKFWPVRPKGSHAISHSHFAMITWICCCQTYGNLFRCQCIWWRRQDSEPVWLVCLMLRLRAWSVSCRLHWSVLAASSSFETICFNIVRKKWLKP